MLAQEERKLKVKSVEDQRSDESQNQLELIILYFVNNKIDLNSEETN